MDILLHSCCGPCSVAVFEELRELGHSFTSYFYNPNIHPYQEHKARLVSWQELCQQEEVAMLCQADYPLEGWLAEVAQNPDERCGFCYYSRLKETAKTAKDQGFSAFSTTLLISPYQNRELIIQIGQEVAAQNQVEFFSRDFRPLFRQGQQKAREMGLYLQKYCGCIYSERDRYLKK